MMRRAAARQEAMIVVSVRLWGFRPQSADRSRRAAPRRLRGAARRGA